MTAPVRALRILVRTNAPTLARLDMLKLDDLKEAILQLECETVLQVVHGNLRHGLLCF